MSTIKAMPRPPDIIVIGAGIVGCAVAYGPMIRCVVWSERCYLVPWDDGMLLAGATV